MPHIHEKIDFCADVYIVYRNKVLLRKHEKYHMWLAPGGHIELDEDPATAAVREVKEEVGLDVTLYDSRLFKQELTDGSTEINPPVGMNRHRINDTHEHISFYYFARAYTDTITQGETEISDEIRWFSKEELENNAYEMITRVKLYALKALELLAE